MWRRLIASGLVVAAVASGWLSAPAQPRAEAAEAGKRILFFHRSQGFEHSVVKVVDGKPCHAEQVLRPLVEAKGWELVSTKDGRVFSADNIAKFDVFLFYTTGDLTAEGGKDGGHPMSKDAKAAMLKAIEEGKGFVGLHCASDTFHCQGPKWENQAIDARDPYIRMIGGEFIKHGAQQSTRMTATGNSFPGFDKVGGGFDMHEEWYSLKNFAPDMHVLLINETAMMKGDDYARPPYPATWARPHGKGRVFYSSMGHREDVWTHPIFQSVLMGGLSWTARVVDAQTPANIDSVTPKASQLPQEPPPKPATEPKKAKKK
jgi:hypothetical protein